MDIAALEADLTTRRGFAASVVAPAGLRNVGYFVWVLGILAAVGALVQHRGAAMIGASMGLFLAVGMVVVVLGLVKERWSLRPLRARYLDRGWVTAQVPCGLVQDNSGDSSLVVRSRVLEGGPRDDSTPIVLVGGRGHSAAAAAVVARDSLAALSKDDAWDLAQRVWAEGLGRDRDAAAFLPVAAGMLLAVQQGCSPYVLVVPAAGRSAGRRPRYYAIRSA